MSDDIHRAVCWLKHRLRATRGGHGIHSPFAYALCENVFYNHNGYYDFERLSKVRGQLGRDSTVLDSGDFGAGSRRFSSSHRKISDVLRYGTSTERQSQLLYRLATFLKVQTCIELGTSIGVNTLYLALQNPKGTVYSIEGSKALCEFASALAARQKVGNIHFLNQRFDLALPDLVSKVTGTTMVYIDGDHSYDATRQYFNSLLPLATGDNVFVLDDIYWSRGMTRAWNELRLHPSVSLSIDTFYSGYLFFRKEIKQRQHYRLIL